MTRRRPVPNWLLHTIERSKTNVDKASTYCDRCIDYLAKGDIQTATIALAKLRGALSTIQVELATARNAPREAQ